MSTPVYLCLDRILTLNGQLLNLSEIGALCLRLGILSVSTFWLRVSSIRTFPPFRKFTDSHNVPCACVMGNLV